MKYFAEVQHNETIDGDQDWKLIDELMVSCTLLPVGATTTSISYYYSTVLLPVLPLLAPTGWEYW